MYLKLLDEAVKEERGETAEIKPECLVDVKVDAFIPETYISNQAQRISCYKKIALIRNEDDAFDVTDELIDRYGEPPKPVYGLIEVAQIRNLAQNVGITEIVQTKEGLNFYTEKPDMQKIGKLNSEMNGRINLNLAGRVCIKITPNKGETTLELMKTILEGIQ